MLHAAANADLTWPVEAELNVAAVLESKVPATVPAAQNPSWPS